jgi:hypothetical protein
VKIVDDAYVGELADAVTGSLGGKVGVAPRAGYEGPRTIARGGGGDS